MGERERPHSWSYYFGVGAGANALFVLGCFLIMIEGLICVILAIPLFSVIWGLAGLAMGALCRWTRWPRHAMQSVAALPLLLGGIEQYLPVPGEVRIIEGRPIVPAAPEVIRRQLIDARDIRPSEIGDTWMCRIGVPLPLSATTELFGGKRIRHITMGKGIHFDQVAADWEPGQRVRWLYAFAADSFPTGALDDRVKIGGAYFDVLDTEYTLRKTKDGTELRVQNELPS